MHGILYLDRIYDTVTIVPDETKKQNVYHCKKKTEFYFSYDIKITINDEIICDDLGCRAVYGGGSHGNMCFVLVETLNTKKLLWLASFDNSNPFISIQREQKNFIVTNNCYEKWLFDISDIDNIKISII
ncbi:MAG: hypothetical protein NC177_04640 [Ruminococcus flavefaciens]|nr:hypothetical protein [Ruminococcus flavefaciens]